MRLTDSRAKLRRADDHLQSLHREIGAFLDGKPYRVVVDNPSNDTFVIRLQDAPEIPAEEWALIVGDCVHNLRAALDYIAWRLAGSDPGDGETQFPIFISKAGWDKNGVRRIKRMSPNAAAFIKALQPFYRIDPPKTALNILRVLDDSDKHKLLTVVAALPRTFNAGWGIKYLPPGDQRLTRRIKVTATINWDARLSGNAILATVNIPDAVKMQMQVQTNVTPHIGFSKGLFDRPTEVLKILLMLVREIGKLIDSFEARADLFS